jgi:hypothetical protein
MNVFFLLVWSRSRDMQLEERSRTAEKRALSLSNTVDILNCKLNDTEAWAEQVNFFSQWRFEAFLHGKTTKFKWHFEAFLHCRSQNNFLF